LRAGIPRSGQLGLDAHTARDARLEPTSLDHHVKTAGQLDPDNLGDVPGAEEHVVDRRIKVLQTPVREDRIVQHTPQYHSTGCHQISRRWRALRRWVGQSHLGTVMNDLPASEAGDGSSLNFVSRLTLGRAGRDDEH
jgi:hypothetical protein